VFVDPDPNTNKIYKARLTKYPGALDVELGSVFSLSLRWAFYTIYLHSPEGDTAEPWRSLRSVSTPCILHYACFMCVPSMTLNDIEHTFMVAETLYELFASRQFWHML